MAITSGLATSCAVVGLNRRQNQLGFAAVVEALSRLVYCTRSHLLSPRCDVGSNSVVKNGDKESKASIFAAFRLRKTSAATDIYCNDEETFGTDRRSNVPAWMSWPELVGVTREEAKRRKIKVEKPELYMHIIPLRSCVRDVKIVQLENITHEETFGTGWSTPAEEEAEPELDMHIIQPLSNYVDVHIIADNCNNDETSGTDWHKLQALKSWSKLVSLPTKEAEKKIKEENPELHRQIIPHDTMVTLDYFSNRFVSLLINMEKLPRSLALANHLSKRTYEH